MIWNHATSASSWWMFFCLTLWVLFSTCSQQSDVKWNPLDDSEVDRIFLKHVRGEIVNCNMYICQKDRLDYRYQRVANLGVSKNERFPKNHEFLTKFNNLYKHDLKTSKCPLHSDQGFRHMQLAMLSSFNRLCICDMFTSGHRLTPANRIRKPSILLQYPILFYRLAYSISLP